jgi:hypothetical protein
MRYIEVVGGIGMGRFNLNDGEPIAGYEEYNREMVIQTVGEFTRENVAKWLDCTCGPEIRPIKDFHAVCDDVEIPWATEEGRETYRHIMELAAAKRDDS